MARTKLDAILAPGSSASAPESIIWTAADTVHGNYFESSGKDLVLARNVNGSGSAAVTIVSVPDALSRLGDIVTTVLFANTKVFGPFLAIGWRNTEGDISLDGAAGIEFAVIALP